MAHADDVAFADEDVGLAEADPAVEHLRGAGDDEERVPVLLELGAGVRVLGVLDGEVVQPELPLDPQEQLAVGLEQPDPDHVPLGARPLARLLDRDSATRRPAR